MMFHKIKIFRLFFLLVVIHLSSVIAQNQYWQKVEGVPGGLIYSITHNGKDLYCAGVAGVYLSNNGADSWENIGLKNETIFSVKCNSSFIYALSARNLYRKSINDTIWQNLLEGNLNCLTVKDSLVFVGTDDYQGIFRSMDSGDSWEQINNGLTKKGVNEIFIASNNNLIAIIGGASGDAVYKSKDFGNQWYHIGGGFAGIAEINNILYAATDANYSKVYKSVDFGETWFLPEYARNPSDQITKLLSIKNELFAITYRDGVYSSSSEGLSWGKITQNLITDVVYDICDNEGEIFLTTEDGVYKLTPSPSYVWEQKSSGIDNANISCLAQRDNDLLVGTLGSGLFIISNGVVKRFPIKDKILYIYDILVSEGTIFVSASDEYDWWQNGGKYVYQFKNIIWEKINLGIQGNISSLAANKKYLFAATNGGVFRKSYSYSQWEKISGNSSQKIICIDSLVVYLERDGNIYKSENFGDSWVKFNNLPFTTIHTFALDDLGNLYLGCKFNKIYKSSDWVNWEKINFHGSNFSHISDLFTLHSEVFASTLDKGIIYSSNYGVSWNYSNYGLNTSNINCIGIYNKNIYVGTQNDGLYRRFKDETVLYEPQANKDKVKFSWKSSEGISKYNIQVAENPLFFNKIIDVNLTDTFYVTNEIGYNKRYFWRVGTTTDYWKNSYTKISEFNLGVPKSVEIYQNYPNPFNNETKIKFEIPENGNVKLILYNIIGENVKTLMNTYKLAGTHYFDLKGLTIASGTYFVGLTINNIQKVIKIIYLK